MIWQAAMISPTIVAEAALEVTAETRYRLFSRDDIGPQSSR
jgi:hypothetical protein